MICFRSLCIFYLLVLFRADVKILLGECFLGGGGNVSLFEGTNIIQLLGHHATFLLAWRQYETLFTKGWAYEHWQSMPGWLFHHFIVVNRNKGDGEGQTQFIADLPRHSELENISQVSSQFALSFWLYLNIVLLCIYIYIYTHSVGYTLRLDSSNLNLGGMYVCKLTM